MLIDKVALLYTQNGQILSTRTKGKDAYYLPGGKREPGESDVQTLVREVREELSVDIIAGSPRLYGVFEAQAHGKAQGITVRMTCYTADFQGTLAPASEIAELRWLSFQDLDKVSPVDRLIFLDLREKGLLIP